MGQRTLILDHEVSPEDFRIGADEAGWDQVAEQLETSATPHEIVFRAGVAGTSTVHYVEDPFIKVRYVLARGPEADAIIEDVVNHFAHAPDDRVLIAAEDEGQSLQYMISWLLSATALGDQAGHDRLRTLIKKRLRHENSGVRRAGLIAASWLEWPDFRATVENMAEDDPDPDARADARRLAGGYRLLDDGEI